MQKALFLYSEATGKGKFLKHIDYILARLESIFNLDVHKTTSQDDLINQASNSCDKYEVLVIAGGDGSFHHVINAIASKPNKPILGYLPCGTICDVGKNFGINRNYKKALDIIQFGFTTNFDIGKANDTYFAYVAAVGAFADIAYATKRKYKKKLGEVAYYLKAIPEALTPKKVTTHIIVDEKSYEMKTPFLLLLNGKYVGGFSVNRKSKIDDGKMELYLTKPGLFNGLLHYLFFKARTRVIVGSSFTIHTDIDMPWCLDGEEGPRGDLRVEIIKSDLRIFCDKKRAKTN